MTVGPTVEAIDPGGTVGPMDRLRPYPVAVFAGITLFIWGNRIWLAWTNTEDTVAEKLVWSTPITGFVLASVAILVLLVRGADPTEGRFRRLVRVFAAGTGIYWAVRLPVILVADHEVPFKVVHSVLAVGSAAVAAAAWRAVARSRTDRAPVEETPALV